MKKVLVFQNQLHDVVEAGSEFPVSPEMVWMDLPDGASSATHEFNGTAIVLKPPVPLPSYRQLRADAYPSIPDQLDLLYHGGMEAWKAAITAVKQKFPKMTLPQSR